MERSARMRELSGCLLAAKVMRLVVALAAYLFAGVSYAAIAESSAVVTWSAAYPATSAIYQSYRVGEDLSNPAQSIAFNTAPTDLAPQSLDLLTPNSSANVLANSRTLTVQSASSNGDIGAEALMTAYFEFSGTGSLDISIPYALTTFVTNHNSSSSVGIFASLEKFDAFSVSTGITEPTPIALFDGGLGTPDGLTGMLSLSIPYNDANDFYALLNINVFSESSAAPAQTVPIPGGIALALPALIPFFASRKKLP